MCEMQSNWHKINGPTTMYAKTIATDVEGIKTCSTRNVDAHCEYVRLVLIERSTKASRHRAFDAAFFASFSVFLFRFVHLHNQQRVIKS